MLSSRALQLATDVPHFSAKTPGRGLKNRAENDYPGIGVSLTVNGKGKNTNRAPRTPFQPASAQPQRLSKNLKTAVKSIGRPLTDKTPLPNRAGTILFQTPLPGELKLSKLKHDDLDVDDEQGGTPDSAQRPSSTRKHVKHPRTSGRSSLETPVNKGNHWDVSDGDIVLPELQQVLQETIAEADDDLDEVEYGPPNTLDLPYEPPLDFTLPNYKEVGKALFQLAHSIPRDDIVPPIELEIPLSQLEELKWPSMHLPELESDDPFHVARTQSPSFEATEDVPLILSSHNRNPPSSNSAGNPSRRPISSISRTRAIGVNRSTSRARAPTSVTISKNTISSTATRPTSATTSVNNDTKRTIVSSRSTSTVTSTRAPFPKQAKPATSSATTRSTSDAKLARATSKSITTTLPAPRRPHTSLAANVNKRTALKRATNAPSAPGQRTKVATTRVLSPVNLIVDESNGIEIIEELEFKFDV